MSASSRSRPHGPGGLRGSQSEKINATICHEISAEGGTPENDGCHDKQIEPLPPAAGDTDREKLKKVLIDQKITWRSWFDGGRIGGPIAKRWNIHSWPSLYVVDHTGTIRHKYLGPPEDYKEFDVLLDKLVQDAERGAAGTGSK